MCMNRNCNNNVMSECRRGCRCNNTTRCNCGKRCICECRFVPRTESVIAVRGPGCINSGGCNSGNTGGNTGSNNVCCGQVSPCGNVQSNCKRRPCDCNCFNRCFRDLLEDHFDNTCPR